MPRRMVPLSYVEMLIHINHFSRRHRVNYDHFYVWVYARREPVRCEVTVKVFNNDQVEHRDYQALQKYFDEIESTSG